MEISNVLALAAKVVATRTFVQLVYAGKPVGILPVNVNDLALGAPGITSLVSISVVHVLGRADKGFIALGIDPSLMLAVAMNVPQLTIFTRAIHLHPSRTDEVLRPLSAMPFFGCRVHIDDFIFALVANKMATISVRLWRPV